MTKNRKQPVKRGVARVPVVMQLEALECGAACLAMILAYYKKWVPLEQLRMDCGISRDGSNALNILKAARHHGLSAQGYRMEPQALRKTGTFPCIIHWQFRHFVVLKGFRGDRAYLNDPAGGSYWLPIEDFDRSFTGICLLFQPTADFVPSGAPVRMLSFAAKRLRGTGGAVAFVALTGLAAAVLNVVKPAFSQVFLDRLLPGQNPDWLTPFLLLLAVLCGAEILISALQAICFLQISGKMAVVSNTSFFWKILRMPLEFFSQRMAGDLQLRQTANAAIANTLIGTVAPLCLDAVMAVLYLFFLLRYNPWLTAIGLSALVLNTILSRYIARRRIHITRVAMQDCARLSTAAVSGIETMETIQASGAEAGFFAKWAGFQSKVNIHELRYRNLDLFPGILPELVRTLADQLILVAGVYLAMNGQFTPGMIFAFQGLMAAFLTPAQSLISAGQVLQEMRTDMERVDDVMEFPQRAGFAPETDGTEPAQKLSGQVDIQDLSFGYSPLAEPLIRDFSLSVSPGKTVAIVGRSGCGKSTVAKLISGLYLPWSGKILFDGKPLDQIPADLFHSSLAVVDQEITVFAGTVGENIKLWDDSIEDFEMILAARDAQLHEDILQRPGGYHYTVAEYGKDFSGGQRQRMEIARVLAQDPTVVVLDEATGSLDAATEAAVVQAIRARGITCIVVAHRLSTIRSADEIILMEQGKICGRGTHEDLMQTSPLYRELVTAE